MNRVNEVAVPARGTPQFPLDTEGRCEPLTGHIRSERLRRMRGRLAEQVASTMGAERPVRLSKLLRVVFAGSGLASGGGERTDDSGPALSFHRRHGPVLRDARFRGDLSADAAEPVP